MRRPAAGRTATIYGIHSGGKKYELVFVDDGAADSVGLRLLADGQTHTKCVPRRNATAYLEKHSDDLIDGVLNDLLTD